LALGRTAAVPTLLRYSVAIAATRELGDDVIGDSEALLLGPFFLQATHGLLAGVEASTAQRPMPTIRRRFSR
jgi:hypothetical protein